MLRVNFYLLLQRDLEKANWVHQRDIHSVSGVHLQRI